MAPIGLRAGAPVSVLATCVLALSLLGVAGGLTLVPGLIPPSGVRSNKPTFTNSQFRYNLNTGAAFNISCSSTHTSSDFTVSFYKDGVVISDGDLEDTTLTETATTTTQKFIQLEFLNFQPVHDGVYHCFANTSDTNEELSSDLYLYGSEFPPPPAVRVTPRYVVLDTSADLVLEARFRGNFHTHEWVYNENDPTFLSNTFSLFTSATVTNVGQTYTIPAGSASLRAWYYGPRVLPTLTGTPIRATPENTVIVGSFVAPTAFIEGLTTAQVTAAAGDDVTFTCLARGFPDTTITIQLSGVNASHTIGDQTLMTEATPTSFMEVNRTVTLHSVTVLDCGAVVTCEGSNMNSDGSTHTDQAAATLQVQAPLSVGVTPSEPVLSVGNMLTLTCTGGDCVGTTTFTFSWFLDGSPVEASLVTKNTTVSQLSVTSVTSADFGTYTCNVTNGNETGSAVAYVRERGSLVFTTDLTAPPMASLHSSLSVMDGETNRYNIEPNAAFSLTCTAESPDDFTLSVSRMPSSATSGFTSAVADSMITMPSTFVKTLTLTYSPFTADLNGIYWCQAVSLTPSNELESRRILLGTGPAAVARVSDLYIELIPPNPLELQVTVVGAYESLTWSRGGVELAGSGSVSFSDFSQTLTVSSTSAGDAGEYTAAVSGSESVAFQIQEFSAPEITVSAPTYVIQGDTLTVNCSVTSFPQSNVSLSLNGTPIMTSVSEDYDSTVGSFTYFTTHSTTAVHPSDEGNYTCSVTITHGQPAVTEVFSDTAFVAVYVRPTVALSVSGPVSVGDVAMFTCTASGGVPSEYSFRWFNGSVEVMSGDSVGITSDGGTSTLMLTVGPDDFVNYTCSVTNTFTEASASNVLMEASFPVPFITPESPDPVVLGSSITLTCASHGIGPFNLTWTVNGILLARAEEVNTSLSLTVDPVSTDNYTSYTCTSQNRDGVNSTSVTLEPAVPPVVTVMGNVTLTVTVNDSFSLQVTLSQYNLQPVTVEWERNGVPLSSGEKYQLSSDTSQLGDGSAELTVRFTESLVDNGTYTVNASNAAGYSSVDFEVFIMIAPKAAILDSQKPTVTFSEGASVALMCTATGVPAPTISWFRNGVLLSNDGTTLVITSFEAQNMTTLSVTSTLTATSVMRDSAFATITCTASNGVGANSSDSTQLIVLFPPIVTDISANQTVTSPAPVSFNCTVDSYPSSNITWLHNGTEVQADPARVTISTVQVDNRRQESTLALLNTTSEDTGTYTCSAVNGVGSGNMTTELQVLVAPEAAILDSQKPTETFSEGASGALMCTATGVPAPTIYWFSNGALSSDDGVTLVITSSTDASMSLLSVTSTLNVTSVTRESAFATITCTASNGVGANSSDSTQLIVLFAPIVANISDNQTVTSPAPVSFSCTVDSYPPSNITWLHNGAEVQSAPPRVNISADQVDNRTQESTLTLFNTTSEDTGTYTCSAVNDEGSTTTTTELQVLVAPEAAILDSQKPTVTFSEGASGALMCTATGVPAPTISWFLNGVGLSDDGVTLVITSPTDDTMSLLSVTSTLNDTSVMRDSAFATITCTASNGVGANSSDTTQLIVLFAPNVTAISANPTVTSPAPVSFNCTVDSYPPSNITWLHNGAEVLADSTRVTISTVQVDNRTQESTLTLLNTTSVDIGNYTCSAVNDEGSTDMTTELQVLEPPEVDITEETFVVNETNPVTLTCVATGIPQPNITWSVAPSSFTLVGGGGSMMVPLDSDGIDYTISSTTRVLGSQNIEVTSTLTVHNTAMNDSGVYTCETMNSLGSVNDTAELIVQFAPEVINISQDQLTVSPDPVVMFCEATGYPRPTIAWFFNGALVTVNENVTIDTDVSPLENTTLGLGRVTSYLRLSVTRPSDAGVYECVPSNLLGRATDRTNLTVHFRAEIDVSTFQDLYVVNEGQNVTFTCSAFGVPAPTISWRRDGAEFSPSSGSRVVLHSEETTQVDYMGPVYQTTRMLTFTDVMDSDTRNINGMMYQCVAVNTVGSSGSANESEDAEDFTLFVRVAPTFTQDVVPTNVTFPDNLTLTCTATARPRPNITWYKDGAELMEGDQVSITSKEEGERVLESNLTLTSPFLDGIGSYTCTAENVVDTANSTAEVTVYSQPFIRGPPVNLTVNQSSQATFSCTAQGNPVLTISWTGPSTNVTTGVTPGANVTTEGPPGANFTVLSVLTIDSAVRAVHEGLYTCRASNGVGPSPSSSAALTVQVPPTVQTVQRRIVGIENTSVTLSFTISDASPEVQTENIQWTFRDLNGNSFNISTNIVNTTFSNLTGVFSSDRLSLTLSGLTNDFEGTYTMTATNEAGSDSATIELVIEGPPRIITPPMSPRVVNDVDVTFDCYALAEPVHSLTWYFVSVNGSNTTIGSVNGTVGMTTDSEKYQITNYTSRADYGRLLVRAVQFEDRGTYMCLAENRHGTDTASATLSVQVPPMFLSTSSQVDVIINSTDAVILNCSLRGYPLSALRWIKGDGTPLDPDGSHITITTFRRQDPTDPYPFSSTTDSSFEPIPLEGLEYFEAVSELTLAPPYLRNDTANYTCEVEAVFVQSFTVTSDDVPVFILEVPDAPFNVTITDNSQRSQVLSWVAPFDGNRPITQYIIYVSSSRQPNLTQIHPPLGGGRTGRQTTGDSTNPVPSVTVTGDPTTVRVSDLIPFVEYSYTVEAINELGRSDMSQPSPFIQTEAATPDSPPRGCEAMVVSSTSFGVMWSSPDPPNGVIANYTIVYRPVEAVADYDPRTLEGNTTSYTDANTTVLMVMVNQSAVLYSIQLAATNQVGTSPFSQALQCTVLTQDDLPGAPQSVSVTSPNSTSLLVTWDHPSAPDRNGLITNYTVNRQTGNEIITTELFSNDTSLLLTDLMPFTVYSITVAGSTSAGRGEFTTPVTRRTRIDNPPSPSPVPTPTSAVGLTVTVPIVKCSDRNGPISHYQIVVVSYSPGVSFDRSRPPNEVFGEDRFVSYGTAMPASDQVLVYVAAEFAAYRFPESKMFTLGSGGPNDNDKYTNPTLQHSTVYTYFVICLPDTTPESLNDSLALRVTNYSLAGFSSFGSEFTTPPEPEDGNIAAIAGGIIVALVLVAIIGIVVIVVVIVIRRRRNKYDVDYQDTNGRGSAVPVFMSVDDEKETTFGRDEAQPRKEIRLPIALSDLPQALENLKRDDNRGYQVEYQSIKDNSPQHPVTNFKLPENKIKNRYGNIMCYDTTRVVLQNVGDEVGADYINASHLSGYNREKEYIASQGPLPGTMGDFWRMVWEQDAATIVMLTQVIEGTKIKCQQYWPSAGEATYGSYVVKVLDTSTYAQYTVRTIEYHPVEEPGNAKTVRQFHFTAWPDFGVPLNGGPLLKFLVQVRKHHSYTNAKPLLVHCSAGVGRTGTFIGLDVELQRASREGVVDPYNFVLHMRDQRNLMVQTENQYIFLYETIMEGIIHDYDEFPVTNLKQRLAQLEDVDKDGLSGAEKEFKNLVSTAKVDTRQFSDANADANKYKNRFMNFLPYNFSRVLLEQQPGIDGSDYINASYIDGYREKAAFIATQGPLPDTMEDFWRLVWEKNTACVVMLTQLVENGIEMCSQYWPASGEKKQCGKYLLVEMTEERTYVDYVHRDFKITFTDEVLQASESRTVSQFHFLAWPERGAPQSGAGMIDLIDQVRRVQMKTSNNPIVVHCSNGTGRTGAFIGLSVALEHVRTEGMVDVYGIVKNLRTQRPHMVQTLEQYSFCYSTIAEYVESMSSYDNFQ